MCRLHRLCPFDHNLGFAYWDRGWKKWPGWAGAGAPVRSYRWATLRWCGTKNTQIIHMSKFMETILLTCFLYQEVQIQPSVTYIANYQPNIILECH